MADLPDDILDALGAIPLLRGIDRRDVSASRLAGLSNASFLLDTPRGRFVLRVPKRDPGDFVDRAREIEAARIAARLGIGAELVDADPATGRLLTRWIAGARPLSARAIRRTPDLLGRIGRTFARLHGSGWAFPAGSTLLRS